MKVEVRCGACGRGHLLDASNVPRDVGGILCQGCGSALVLPVVSPPPPPASGPKPPPAPGRLPVPPEENVVCPRCGLHFQPAAARSPAQSGARPTVLLVEDMPYFQEMAKEALASKYEVKQAGSVSQAIEILSSSRVDLILLDLVLDSGEDGLAVLRSLPRKPCPVLLFTAEDESNLYGERWEELRALGADDLVLKGMNTGEILARKVDELLATRTA